MSTDDNKRVARRMTDEVWNEGKPDVLDEICAPSYHLHGTGGIAELKRNVAAMRRAFPDLRFTVDEMIAEGDAVASRWTWRGTHLGAFEDIAPTGKALAATGITIFHFADGKIVDDRFEVGGPDLRQLLLGA
jgi:steroid delta-isomerase-like uncharacterized protein